MLRLCEAGVVETLVPTQVLTKADRTVPDKLPGLVADYRLLIQSIAPTLDAPILAAALVAEADYLITWNTKHFHQLKVGQAVRFQIVTPGEFLLVFRNSLPET
jgi:hypothetical protein